MMKRSPIVRATLAAAAVTVVALAILVPGFAGGATKSNKALVAAHGKALAECSAEGLVNGYTSNATLFFPDGVVVKGRKALTELYEGFVKSPEEEGLCGLKATPVLEWEEGGTSFVKFRVTAPFLAKTYFSTDGYVFKGGKIAAEMSTFDASKLVFKKTK
jgi:hypothetical protein